MEDQLWLYPVGHAVSVYPWQMTDIADNSDVNSTKYNSILLNLLWNTFLQLLVMIVLPRLAEVSLSN